MIPRLNIHFGIKDQAAFFSRHNMYIPEKNEFMLNHSRSALALALMAMDLPKDKSVGIMIYNCHTVMSAVCKVGLSISFIDVTDELKINREDLRQKRDNISVLIITHLFGIRNDVASIKEEFPDLIVIEDCAHLYGANITGDFATFSIGQGKFPSVGDGGILVVNNKKYLTCVNKLYVKLSDYSIVDECCLFIKLLVKAFLYSPFIYGIVTYHLQKRNSSMKDGLHWRICRMSHGICSMYNKARANIKSDTEKQIRVAEQMTSQLKGKSAYYGENAFMVIVRTDNPCRFQNELLRKGIVSATHFAHCIDWAKDFGYISNSCPNAQKLVGQLTMIPTYRTIKL